MTYMTGPGLRLDENTMKLYGYHKSVFLYVSLSLELLSKYDITTLIYGETIYNST